jgi:hypothetical protein
VKILALDKVVWSTEDEGRFRMMDKAASRHTARGVDAGADSDTTVRSRQAPINEHILGSNATISLKRVSTVVSRCFQSARSALL